jgi:hypothetical protein
MPGSTPSFARSTTDGAFFSVWPALAKQLLGLGGKPAFGISFEQELEHGFDASVATSAEKLCVAQETTATLPSVDGRRGLGEEIAPARLVARDQRKLGEQ